ncbi:MAG TPA: glycosyltransferase [Candidatus Polarisedimenticolia bacterium]|nr:glycosyltransferase [Candidatus Polarisedimenticolia bacterium]
MSLRLAALVVFWASAAILVYVHLGVPAILRLVAAIRRKPVAKGEHLPSVSIVICAYNEAKHLRAKLEDTVRLDYPSDRIEILVISDASTDGTDAIARGFPDPRVRLHTLPARSGKTVAQNVAVGLARNDVLFFTDATVLHPPGTLRLLLRSLADPTVGCVTGRVVFKHDAGAVSRGLEGRFAYEMGTRSALGDVFSLLGTLDCAWVVPRALYREVPGDLDTGFVGALMVLERGRRTVYEPEAQAFVDRPVPGLGGEFERRARIVLRGLRGLLFVRRLLNPLRHGVLAWALWSTRLLRWLTPVFMLTALLANLALLDQLAYRVLLALQGVFYLLAGIGAFLAVTGRGAPSFIALPFYFCLLAASATAAIGRLLKGDTGQVWTTVR